MDLQKKSVRQRAVRSDSLKNRQLIIAALETSIKNGNTNPTMTEIAKEAGLAPATAYRYFPTLDSLHRQFLLSVIEELDLQTEELSGQGEDLFRKKLRIWMKIVEEAGPAMVFVSSRFGFLDRLFSGEAHVKALEKVWGIPIKQILEEQSIDLQWYPIAFALFNALINVRDILDYKRSTDWSAEELEEFLAATFIESVRSLGSLRSPGRTLPAKEDEAEFCNR
ncbi:MAG: TetR/AcrR family transcriptional regulator [Corynebacterium sp.]|nr:TetR/AcrR family transcriptional regulator [Corynebacterium sp.]